MTTMTDRDRPDAARHPLDPAPVVWPWVMAAWATVRLRWHLR